MAVMESLNIDDWRIETKRLLNTSKLYLELKNKCESDASGEQVMSLISDAVYYAYQRTKTIITHMGEYTLHDGEHLFRVLHMMEKLIPQQIVPKLTVPELMLLVLTAFFHDIGMAPSLSEVTDWGKFWDKENNDKLNDPESYEQFSKYCSGFPNILLEIENFHKAGQHSKSELLKKHLISEYIRNTHADRARKIIEGDWNEKIRYRDIDLTAEFAQLCFSHNEDAATLIELDSSLICGPGVYACLPFIGVVLRLADILDFDAKRTPKVLFSHLFIRNPISLREWQKHRSIAAWDISASAIRFQARCEHPAIELTIRQFCDIIDMELAAGNAILNNLKDSVRSAFPDHYKISLPIKVDRSKISPVKKVGSHKPIYNYQETRFTLNKSQVIDLLMGTKLYARPEVALRELLQNSIDACLVREAMTKSWDNSYLPKITVKFFKCDKEDILEVIDNGTGMDLEIINKFYSSIGTSYYKSAQFYELKATVNLTYTPISRFGIGILSCFMVSDYLKVNTKRLRGPYESSESLEIVLEGHDSIFWVREGALREPGTTTQLTLRKDHPWKHFTEQKIIDSITRILPHPPFPIEIITENNTTIHTGEEFKKRKIEELKDYQWKEDTNVIEIPFEFPANEFGIVGKGLAAIIVSKKVPSDKIFLSSKTINVDGEEYELERYILYSENGIKKTAQTIEVDEYGYTQLNDSNTSLAQSKAIVALHGIEIPFNVFPESWLAKNQKVRLAWPFPLLLILDITGDHDLNLNSARTEIIFDDKWVAFEQNLATLVLQQIKTKIGNVNKWEKLKKILLKSNKCEHFANAIEKI